MSTAAKTSTGAKIPIIVPSRYYQSYLVGNNGFGSFSASSMVDFLARQGFDGIDLSLDAVDVFDDSLKSVYLGLARRAREYGLSIPVCHLPFFMPPPDDVEAMRRYSRSVLCGVDIAAALNIPVAVIHPIVRHSSRCCYERWIKNNLEFLTPVCNRARERGVSVAIENMAGVPYKSVSGDKAFGCRAEDIVLLADNLGAGVCWDTGHANITGLCQSAELSVIGGRLTTLHIHGNDGKKDAHLLPCNPRSTMDVDDLVGGLKAIGFADRKGVYLDFEVKTSHLTADRDVRDNFASLTLKSAKWFAKKL